MDCFCILNPNHNSHLSCPKLLPHFTITLVSSPPPSPWPPSNACLRCVFRIPANRGKNRYSDVLCYDHSRVTLTQVNDDPNSDYINANYVDGYKQKNAFISSQGSRRLEMGMGGRVQSDQCRRRAMSANGSAVMSLVVFVFYAERVSSGHVDRLSLYPCPIGECSEDVCLCFLILSRRPVTDLCRAIWELTGCVCSYLSVRVCVVLV